MKGEKGSEGRREGKREKGGRKGDEGKEGWKGRDREERKGGRERRRDGEVCSAKLRGAVSLGQSPSIKMSLEQGYTCHPPPHLHPDR